MPHSSACNRLALGLTALALIAGILRPADAAGGKQRAQPRAATLGVTSMKVWSPDFQNGQAIPAKFTCDGENVSPALAWSEVPAAAKSLALVIEDPDAPSGMWVHWIVTDLPPQCRELPSGGPVPKGAVQVANDFRRPEYGGPCPPSGTHRYFFRLYALDTPKLAGVTRQNYAAEFKRHALASAETLGVYRRQ
jgi:Raf kinase inhibitor-like YbhB/YbcL family protein